MNNNKVKIAWYGKHFGEEPPLIGYKDQGAGGIFFTGCHLQCVFCQNYQISQEDLGREYTVDELARIMLSLQESGAVNIDLVTPTIWWKAIKQAVLIARKNGLYLPIIWNSNGYEAVEVLRQMDGVVDVYLPDFKYSDDSLGFKYSGIKKYSVVAEKALREMLRQVGEDKIIVRHLILPGHLDNTLGVLKKIAEINNQVSVSLMNQYNPLYRANEFENISRMVSKEEFNQAYEYLLDLGFERGWVQDGESRQIFNPDFRKNNPF